jgi:hypothetical protein
MHCKLLPAIAAIAVLLGPSVLQARECWRVIFSGPMAEAPSYSAVNDRLSGPVVVCFFDKTGEATGNDVPLARMGPSTLAGFSDNGKGGRDVCCLPA